MISNLVDILTAVYFCSENTIITRQLFEGHGDYVSTG